MLFMYVHTMRIYYSIINIRNAYELQMLLRVSLLKLSCGPMTVRPQGGDEDVTAHTFSPLLLTPTGGTSPSCR